MAILEIIVKLFGRNVLEVFYMSKINIIQNAIKELEGGSFQKLFDAY